MGGDAMGSEPMGGEEMPATDDMGGEEIPATDDMSGEEMPADIDDETTTDDMGGEEIDANDPLKDIEKSIGKLTGKIRKTDFLLPNNDFIIGLGSVLNLLGSYFEYNYSNSSKEADFKALESDWQNVGEDIRKSFKKVKKANENEDICLTY